MKFPISLFLALASAGLAVPCTATDLVLAAKDRKGLGLTVYDSFAVVRDVREAVLERGIVDVDFQDIPPTIDPASVRVASLGKEDLFSVREQTYRYDLLNKQSLLRRYIGKKLKYSRTVQEGKTYERVLREGILLSIDPEIVKFGDEVEIAPEGVISLPYVPEGLKTTPTLSWRANNRVKGAQSIETSYLADGFSWSADYRLDLNDDESAGSLSVWVSVKNSSGVDYPGASLSLVAGDVKRADAGVQPRFKAAPEAAMMRMSPNEITGKPLSEYYTYSMPEPVDLNNNQTSQFRLLAAENVAVKKTYLLVTDVGNRMLQEPLEDRFEVQFGFDNKSGSGLGVPLPKGSFRVFKSNDGGVPQLLGEDDLVNTPRDEHATVTVGKAFDLVAEHTQTEYRRTGDRSMEISYRVDVHNRKPQAVNVTLDERMFGDWTITKQSEPGKKKDATTQEYVLSLGPDAEKTFSFTAKIDL